MSETLEHDWYLLLEGESQGPYGADDLRAWVAEGRIAADTLCWNEAMTDWAPVAIALGLAETGHPPLETPLPPPTPSPAPASQDQPPPVEVLALPPRKGLGRGVAPGIAAVLVLAALLVGGYALYRAIFPGYPPEVAKAYALYEAGQYGRAYLTLEDYLQERTDRLREAARARVTDEAAADRLLDESMMTGEIPDELRAMFREHLHPEALMLMGRLLLVHPCEVLGFLIGEEGLTPDNVRQARQATESALSYATAIDPALAGPARDIIVEAAARIRFKTPEEAAGYFFSLCVGMLHSGDVSEFTRGMSRVSSMLHEPPTWLWDAARPVLENPDDVDAMRTQYEAHVRETYTDDFIDAFETELSRMLVLYARDYPEAAPVLRESAGGLPKLAAALLEAGDPGAPAEPAPEPGVVTPAPEPAEPATNTEPLPAADEQGAAAAQERLARLEAEVIALLAVPSVESSDYQFGRAQQDCRKALRMIDEEPALGHLRAPAQELLAWLDLAVTPEQRFVLEGHMATGEQTLLHIRDLLDQERVSVRLGRMIRGYEVVEFDAASSRITLKRGTRTHYIYSR